VLYLPLPSGLYEWLLEATLVAYLACLGGAAWRLRRSGTLRDFGPSFVLVVNQALWTVIPAVTFSWGAARHGTLFFAAVWLSAAHSAQYLWVTAYYARASDRPTSVKRFLAKALVAGTAVTILPVVILGPSLLGHLPFDAGLAACAFAMVNLHHFILDGAIWKLRDGRVARVLLRAPGTPELPQPIDAPPRTPWLRRGVWALAAVSVAIPVLDIAAVRELRNADDPARIDRATAILRWTGRERVRTHVEIGERLAAAGRHGDAVRHFRRSIELFPTGRAWGALGVSYRALGEWEEALTAFDAALALNPDFAGAHFRRAEALLATATPETEAAARQRALASLDRALALRPSFPQAARLQARLRVESGARDDARATLVD
jgi:tetratricopeptide (TPR) repeat protein